MTSIKTLAVALLAFSAVPALATERRGVETNHTSNRVTTGGQSSPTIQGRDSDRMVIDTNKARAATSQGFAPIDTQSIINGPNR
jgi:hypothetical protein